MITALEWQRAIAAADLNVVLFKLCEDGVIALRLARPSRPLVHISIVPTDDAFVVWISGRRHVATSLAEVISACAHAAGCS